MIVADSSIWIAHFRGSDDEGVQKLRDHVAEIVVGDVILLEVLQGARDDGHATRIERELNNFPVAAMLDARIAVQAARNFRLLRARGITIRRTVDLIIGTFCIIRGHSLLHNDRDFDPMQAHLGLQII